METKESLWQKLRDHGLQDSEIEKKIEEKRAEVQGLLTEEGILSILISELGITEKERYPEIGDLVDGMSDVNVLGRVLGVSRITEFERKDGTTGRVARVYIADKTGKVSLVLWDQDTSLISDVNRGDVLKVVGGSTKDSERGLDLYLGKGRLISNPTDDPRVDELPPLSKLEEKPHMRMKISELEESDGYVEVRGTIVKLYSIRIYDACPECFKKVRFEKGIYYCDRCGKQVLKKRTMILDIGIDDCTGFLRLSFFGDRAEQILEKETKEVYFYLKEYLDKGYDLRSASDEYLRTRHTELLGRETLVSGRIFSDQYRGITLRVSRIEELDVRGECGRILEEIT
ncbi:MAG: hypothetical protein ACE5HW_00760 [Candidatus Methanofastidiosia archaeon]